MTGGDKRMKGEYELWPRPGRKWKVISRQHERHLSGGRNVSFRPAGDQEHAEMKDSLGWAEELLDADGHRVGRFVTAPQLRDGRYHGVLSDF